MGIRLPLKKVLDVTDTGTSGATNYLFTVPQDSDNVLVKFWTGATFTGTSPTADVYVQTSDDGGTTWFDCANIGQITAAVAQANARFVSIPTIASSVRGVANFIGSVQASTTASAMTTGLPLLSTLGRITVKYGGTQLTNTNVRVQVLVNSQAAPN